MPPRRRLKYPIIEGESASDRRRRLQREARQRNRLEQHQQNRQPTNNNGVPVGPEATPPTVSPGTVLENRRRQVRHSERRYRGRPSRTPPSTSGSVVATRSPLPAGVDSPHVFTNPVGLLTSAHFFLKRIADGGDVDEAACVNGLNSSRYVMSDFFNKCSRMKLAYCTVCKESKISTDDVAEDGICGRCSRDYVDNERSFYSYGFDNDLDPYCGNGYPFHLPALSTVEELMISKVFVVMTCYRLSHTGEYGYKGHCLNLQTDLGRRLEIFNVLPHLPEELPIYVIKVLHENSRGQGNLFKVNLRNCMRWLYWLKENNPSYHDVEISYDRYGKLCSLANHLGVLNLVDYLPGAVELPSDNTDSVEEKKDDEVESEMANGPEQGGATGLIVEDDVDNIEEGHLFVSSESLNENYEATIRDLINNSLGTESNPLEIDFSGPMVSDYDTPGLQGLAFPTLFPYGTGDVTRDSRTKDVTVTNAFKHYLQYSVFDEHNKLLVYPFSKHKRWMHWAQNLEERHRFLSQRRVFLRRNTKLENISEENLRRIVSTQGPEFEELISSMQLYNSNIVGSNAYFYKRRRELEALIEVKGIPTAWFTFSAADNHWCDLHDLLYKKDEVRVNNRRYVDFNEKEKLVFRMNILQNYHHLVDQYFYMRFQAFLKEYFSENCLDVDYCWFRVEYQSRGTAHVHGCYKLKSDPGISELCEIIRDGRYAREVLNIRGIEIEVDFDDYNCKDDEWLTLDDFVDKEMSDVHQWDESCFIYVDELQEKVKKGVEAEKIVCKYNDFLFTTVNDDPPEDALSDDRLESTKFVQSDNNRHPSSVSQHEFFNMNAANRQVQYCQLVNTVQRHCHSKYCMRKVNGCMECRFGFPLDVQERTHIQIKQYFVRNKKGLLEVRYAIECLSARNDKWLNSHCKLALQCWMANVDMRLVCDVGKVVQYLTKYITKTEKNMTAGMRYLIKRVLLKSLDDGNSALHSIKKIMSRLIGNRVISRQETCHLINSLPLVSCTHNFVTISLVANKELLENNNVSTGETTENNTANNLINLLDEENTDVARVKSIVEMYAVRENTTNWKNSFEIPNDVEQWNLCEFACNFRVGQRGEGKNKIVRHTKNNIVPVFVPNVEFSSEGEGFVKYVKFFIMKYMPWKTSPATIWGDVPVNQSHLRNIWEQYLDTCAREGRKLPDKIRREVAYFNSVSHLFEHNTIAVINEEDIGGIDVSVNRDNEDNINLNRNTTQPDSINLDDDEICLVWNEENDWVSNMYEYEKKPSEYVNEFKTYIEEAKNNFVESEFRHVCRSQLQGNQLIGHDIVVHFCTKNDFNGGLICMFGMGGCGKSFVIDAIRTTLKEKFSQDVVVTSTTGITANAVKGVTVHSALNLPVPPRRYANLSEAAIREFQDKYSDINLLVIDEFSMLRAKELFYVSERLKQIKCNDYVFGGVLVLLVGDPGQLPPVKGKALWGNDRTTGLDQFGRLLFCSMLHVVHLDKNLRLDASDSDAVFFNGFLQRLRNGSSTHDDFIKVANTCCRHRMGENVFRQRGFLDDDVSFIYTTNAECTRANAKRLIELKKPILRIRSTNTGEARYAKSSELSGLEYEIFVCVGCTIMLTKNISQPLGLSNGTTAIIRDFVFAENCETYRPGRLPLIVWIEVCNNAYCGGSFFPDDDSRKNWVPIYPIVAEFSTYKAGVRVVSSRTMYPFKMCYAWTAWKVQGQTIRNKVVCDLSKQEKSDGLAYVIFSRVTKLTNLGIIGGFSRDRITTKIARRASFKMRREFEFNTLIPLSSRTKQYYLELFGEVKEGVEMPSLI